VLSELPAEAALLVSQQAFIPGCIMMLADIAVPQEGGEEEEEGAEGSGAESDDEEVLGGSWDSSESFINGGELEEIQQQQQQVVEAVHQLPAYLQGFWRVPVSCTSAKNALTFLAYASLSDFEARVNDGSLLQALAALFPSEVANQAAAVAEAASDPIVVGVPGGELQVILELPLGPLASSSSSTGNSTPSSGPVRVVLVQGQHAVVDQVYQVERLANCMPLRLQLQAGSSSSLPGSASVMALYVLPAFQKPSGSGSSSAASSGGGSSSTQGAAPLAHLTVLLLPPAAAAELMFWVEQQQLSHEVLQPLLEDMAVAIEGATAAAGGGVVVAGAAAVWAQAAEACQRTRSFLEQYALVECEDLMAVCLQRLLLRLHTVQPLAAGALPSPSLAAAAGGADASGAPPARVTTEAGPSAVTEGRAGASAAVAQGVPIRTQGVESSKVLTSEESSLAGSGKGAGERAVAAAAAGRGEAMIGVMGGIPGVSKAAGEARKHALVGTPGDAVGTSGHVKKSGMQSVSSMQGMPPGSISSGTNTAMASSSNAAAAAAGCQVWLFTLWCVAGALKGWSNQRLEAGYQATRRPSTWFMMGCLDLVTNILTGGRILAYVVKVWAEGAAWGLAAGILPVEAVGVAYGLWLLLFARRKGQLVGLVATVQDLTVCVLLLSHVFLFGPGGLGEVLPASFNKAQPSLMTITALFGAVRIVLHQLPPPWLLWHATFLVMKVWAIYSCSPELWYVPAGLPVLLQVSGVCAAAVAVVVVQEAISRGKYIRLMASRHAVSAATGCNGGVGSSRMKGEVSTGSVSSKGSKM
jgi:hypothetical protein